jgi:hypothetical protein
MSKIIIQLQGGLVQEVFLQGQGLPTKALVVDEDVEGADPQEITTVLLKDRTYEACIHTETISKLPENSDVAHIVSKYPKGK